MQLKAIQFSLQNHPAQAQQVILFRHLQETPRMEAVEEVEPITLLRFSNPDFWRSDAASIRTHTAEAS